MEVKSNLEIERRFLIELPLKWYAKFKIFTSPKERIVQTYLKGDDNHRVRIHIWYDNSYAKVKYTCTRKEYVAYGVNEEFECEISQEEYRNKLVDAYTNKYRISKYRYKIDFYNQKFEFDIFQDRLKDLAILEIELDNINKNVLIPPYLKVIKEITGDKYYSNYNLASLSRYPEEKFPRRID